MDQIKEPSSLDEILAGFNIDTTEPEGPIEGTNVSIWLPMDYKFKYDDLQRRSKRQFGKILRRMIMKSIDQVGA